MFLNCFVVLVLGWFMLLVMFSSRVGDGIVSYVGSCFCFWKVEGYMSVF